MWICIPPVLWGVYWQPNNKQKAQWLCIYIFGAFSLMHRWPIQNYWNPDCIESNSKAPFPFNFISLSFILLQGQHKHQWIKSLHVWSLCMASPGFCNCNFPATLPASAPRLVYKNKASLEPAGNNFCVTLGCYVLGRNIKLTLNDKQFVVLIFSVFLPPVATLLLETSPRCLYDQHELPGFER